MSDDLEEVVSDATIESSPSAEPQDETVVPEPLKEEEKELTDEELKAEIERLKEEVKVEEDAKEKRYKEQDIGWKMKTLKEREKAENLAKENRTNEEALNRLKSTLIDEAYTKTVDDKFGLPYFEKFAKSNPELADQLARDKWGKKDAKQLIFDTKKQFADNGDEEAKKIVTEEEIRSAEREKVYHEISLEQVATMFDDLNVEEKAEAKEYFDDIADGKKLTPEKAKKYAEMAKFYATRNRKPEKVVIDKDRIIAEKANTGIAPKSWSKEAEVWDRAAIIQQLVNSWVQRDLAEAMFP